MQYYFSIYLAKHYYESFKESVKGVKVDNHTIRTKINNEKKKWMNTLKERKMSMNMQ